MGAAASWREVEPIIARRLWRRRVDDPPEDWLVALHDRLAWTESPSVAMATSVQRSLSGGACAYRGSWLVDSDDEDWFSPSPPAGAKEDRDVSAVQDWFHKFLIEDRGCRRDRVALVGGVARHAASGVDRLGAAARLLHRSDRGINAEGLLGRALRDGRGDVTRVLLECGCDAATEIGGIPALHVAAALGRCDAAARLLDFGADVDAAVDVAVEYRSARAGKRGTRVGYWETTALVFAARHGRVDAVRLLLRRGADVRRGCVRPLLGGDPFAMTLLRAVRAAGGWLERVPPALAKRARPAGRRAVGTSPPRARLVVLRVLAERGRAATAEGLLARLFPSDAGAPGAVPADVFSRVLAYWD